MSKRCSTTAGCVHPYVMKEQDCLKMWNAIFQPFYTTKAQGLGLGLAICRSIAEAHAGRLWAEPNSERGAILHFELPVSAPQNES